MADTTPAVRTDKPQIRELTCLTQDQGIPHARHGWKWRFVEVWCPGTPEQSGITPMSEGHLQDVPEPPDDRPAADPGAVHRARTDDGTRAMIARAMWRTDTVPSTAAQTGGYLWEYADRVAVRAIPEIEQRFRQQIAAEVYAEARTWAVNAQTSTTAPERERCYGVAAALTKAASDIERGEA